MRPRGASWRRAIFDACETKCEMGVSRVLEEQRIPTGDIGSVSQMKRGERGSLVGSGGAK